jgi:hypothetical protein
MALDHSAPLEVLDALKVADVDDRIRQATESLYQALIGGTDSGISKSEVSRICADLDNEVSAFADGSQS